MRLLIRLSGNGISRGKTSSVIYKDNGSDKDWGGDFFSIMNALKKQEWLMRNVAAWILYDSDDSDSPDDLIVHYARKRTVGHKTSVPVGSR